jgi:hypothetical protein
MTAPSRIKKLMKPGQPPSLPLPEPQNPPNRQLNLLNDKIERCVSALSARTAKLKRYAQPPYAQPPYAQ